MRSSSFRSAVSAVLILTSIVSWTVPAGAGPELGRRTLRPERAGEGEIAAAFSPTAPAGAEEIPAVEVIHPKRLRGFEPAGILFDFDRTLWQGFPRGFEAWRLAVWLKGQEIPKNDSLVAQVREFLDDTDGMSWAERRAVWPKEVPRGPGGYPETVREQIDRYVKKNELTESYFLTWGARDLLEAFKAASIPMAIVTGGRVETRKQYALDLGISRFFGGQVYGDGNKKITIAQAAQEWGVAPSRVAVIGDGIPDIKAARANGAVAVAFARSPEQRKKLVAAGADLVIYENFLAAERILGTLNVPLAAPLRKDPLTAEVRAGYDLEAAKTMIARTAADLGPFRVRFSKPEKPDPIVPVDLEAALQHPLAPPNEKITISLGRNYGGIIRLTAGVPSGVFIRVNGTLQWPWVDTPGEMPLRLREVLASSVAPLLRESAQRYSAKFEAQAARATEQLAEGVLSNAAGVEEITSRILIGHTGSVRSVAISPDGKRLVSGSIDGTVRLWDLSPGLASANAAGVEEIPDEARAWWFAVKTYPGFSAEGKRLLGNAKETILGSVKIPTRKKEKLEEALAQAWRTLASVMDAEIDYLSRLPGWVDKRMRDDFSRLRWMVATILPVRGEREEHLLEKVKWDLEGVWDGLPSRLKRGPLKIPLVVELPNLAAPQVTSPPARAARPASASLQPAKPAGLDGEMVSKIASRLQRYMSRMRNSDPITWNRLYSVFADLRFDGEGITDSFSMEQMIGWLADGKVSTQLWGKPLADEMRIAVGWRIYFAPNVVAEVLNVREAKKGRLLSEGDLAEIASRFRADEGPNAGPSAWHMPAFIRRTAELMGAVAAGAEEEFRQTLRGMPEGRGIYPFLWESWEKGERLELYLARWLDDFESWKELEAKKRINLFRWLSDLAGDSSAALDSRKILFSIFMNAVHNKKELISVRLSAAEGMERIAETPREREAVLRGILSLTEIFESSFPKPRRAVLRAGWSRTAGYLGTPEALGLLKGKLGPRPDLVSGPLNSDGFSKEINRVKRNHRPGFLTQRLLEPQNDLRPLLAEWIKNPEGEPNYRGEQEKETVLRWLLERGIREPASIDFFSIFQEALHGETRPGVLIWGVAGMIGTATTPDRKKVAWDAWKAVWEAAGEWPLSQRIFARLFLFQKAWLLKSPESRQGLHGILASASAAGTEEAQPENVRFLVADDSELIREHVRDYLGSFIHAVAGGHLSEIKLADQIVFASSPEEGEEKLSGLPRGPLVAVLDLQMGSKVKTGLDLAKQVREQHPDALILMLSSTNPMRAPYAARIAQALRDKTLNQYLHEAKLAESFGQMRELITRYLEEQLGERAPAPMPTETVAAYLQRFVDRTVDLLLNGQENEDIHEIEVELAGAASARHLFKRGFVHSIPSEFQQVLSEKGLWNKPAAEWIHPLPMVQQTGKGRTRLLVTLQIPSAGAEEGNIGTVAVEGVVAAVPAWARRSTYGVTVGLAQTKAGLELGTLSPGRFIVVSAGTEEDRAIAELGVPPGQIVRDKTAAIELAGAFLQMAEGFLSVRVLDTTAATPAELRPWLLGLPVAWQGAMTAGVEQQVLQLEEMGALGV